MSEEIKSKSKGGRPPKELDVQKVLASPQGQQALKAMVEATMGELAPKIAESLAAARGPVAAETTEGDKSFVSSLARTIALSIAELTDQGTGRKRIDPEILKGWVEARERMIDLLVQNRADQVMPRYRLISETYLGCELIAPFKTNPATKAIESVEIGWDGVPNEAMEPVDEPAKQVFAEFLASIGGYTSLFNRQNTKWAADMRPLSVTAGGLIIHGTAAGRRTVSNLADSANGTPGDSNGPRRTMNPNAKEVHVLGTIAEPARQNFAGELRR